LECSARSRRQRSPPSRSMLNAASASPSPTPLAAANVRAETTSPRDSTSHATNIRPVPAATLRVHQDHPIAPIVRRY
jgi:hypothetical protein